MKYIMITDIDTHTPITQILKIENIQQMVLSYSFRKAVVFFDTSSDEMNKLPQQSFATLDGTNICSGPWAIC